jgi:hypothetical protein
VKTTNKEDKQNSSERGCLSEPKLLQFMGWKTIRARLGGHVQPWTGFLGFSPQTSPFLGVNS